MPLDSDLSALEADASTRLEELIAEAERSAVTWRWAVGAPLPHRLEPYLHERARVRRGEFVEEPGDERYGFDEHGQVLIVPIDVAAVASVRRVRGPAEAVAVLGRSGPQTGLDDRRRPPSDGSASGDG